MSEKFLNFVKARGYDLELATAASLRQAGFWVGQGMGVMPWRPHTDPTVLPQEPDEHDGREVDVIAVYQSATQTPVAFVLAVECKSFQQREVGVLSLDFDGSKKPATEFVVDGRFRGVLEGKTGSFRLELDVDCTGFNLIAQEDKDREPKIGKGAYEPTWNALRQVLDAAIDVASLPIVSAAHMACVVPLLVIGAPLYAVGLGSNGELTSRPIASASVRVAAHKGRVHREVYVVTRDGLPQFAKQTLSTARRFVDQIGESLGASAKK